MIRQLIRGRALFLGPFFLGVVSFFMASCEFSASSEPDPEQNREPRDITVSDQEDSFGEGLKWVWFGASQGTLTAWGPDTLATPPDSSTGYFRIVPAEGYFASLELQNKMRYGVIFLGTGDSVFEENYQGDSLEFFYDLTVTREWKAGNVYYLRDSLGACQIKILAWEPLNNALSFAWRPLPTPRLGESEMTVRLPEEGSLATDYFFNVREGQVWGVAPGEEPTEAAAFEFRIDPGAPEFSTPFYESVLGYGIAYLGTGEVLYNSDEGRDNRLLHNYRNDVTLDFFQVNAVYYIRTYNGEGSLLILSWDKAKSTLRFKYRLEN